jgi:hypothetical protein
VGHAGRVAAGPVLEFLKKIRMGCHGHWAELMGRIKQTFQELFKSEDLEFDLNIQI